MRIQHNIMAMNAYRNYNTNTSALSKNLEKLSSGYKINRAGDDAAGLAISEKMRMQITGLDKAQDNAKDGISLVQTAEGALTEVHDMLNRMYELAEQSANGTYDEKDRDQLQKEVDALNEEIDRISKATNFNGIKLLDGSNGGGATGKLLDIEGTINGAKLSATAQAAKTAVYTLSLTGKGSTDIGGKKIDGVNIAWNTSLATTLNDFVSKYNAAGKDYTAKVSSGKIILTANKAGAVAADPTTDTGVAFSTTTKGLDEGNTYKMSGTFKTGDKITINGVEYTYASQANGTDGKTFKDLTALKAAAAKNGVTLDIGTPGAVTAKLADAGNNAGGGLKLQIGDTGDDYNQITVSIAACDAATLGTAGLKIDTQDAAKNALNTIKAAIESVSDVRGGLGAIQNRLEHTINNLSVMEENIQNAESSIRDTDVAEEMMAYTKNNILIQSAQAMLAQANQVPQGVLQLLQ